MRADWSAVRKKASEIRDKYPVLFGPPVDVFEIARSEGIEIIYFNPDTETQDISGLLNREDKTIFLNADESPARQAYTLAHELAHYFLNHKPNEYGVYRRDSLYKTLKPAKEQEADFFAAELLMPRDLVEQTLKKYHLQKEDVVTLAKIFGVSRAAMTVRLKDLYFNERAK